MSDHLTIEHLAAYLPYELKVKCNSGRYILSVDDREEFTSLTSPFISVRAVMDNPNMRKPILRPLSDLTKGIDVYESFPLWRHQLEAQDLLEPENLPYEIFNCLVCAHYDVFNLIEKGLAVDINTIEG